MRNVYIKKTIRIRLTADDWQLYGDEGSVAREMAAYQMNEKIENILNDHPPKEDAWISIGAVLKQYSSFGAYDSEGMHVASDLLELFYKGESK
jgi:hypothetical protein